MTQAQKIIKFCAIALALFIIFSIITGIFSLMVNISYSFVSEEVGDFTTTTYDNVLNLNIDLPDTKLTIKKGEEFKIETNSKDIIINKENDTLKLKNKKKYIFSKKLESKTIIYIPNELDKVSLKLGAGNIDINSLSVKELDFEIGAGKVNIENLNVSNNISLDTGAGEVNISAETLNNLDLDMGVGKVTINAKLTGSTDIDAGVGELNINILEKLENYKLKIDKGIGTIRINNEEVSSNTFGSGINLIEIDGGVGSINIKSED